MSRILAGLFVSLVASTPLLAQGMDDAVTCDAFTQMPAADQMAAVDHAMMAGDGMAGDAMAEGDAMAADGAMADDHMASAMAACDAHPDMTLTDAMGMMQ